MENEKIFASHNSDKELIPYTLISFISITLFNNVKINQPVKNEKRAERHFSKKIHKWPVSTWKKNMKSWGKCKLEPKWDAHNDDSYHNKTEN